MLKKYLYLTLLALLCFATGLGAQQTRVRGVVTDKDGEPVPGVSVLIQGTSSGVVTASDGSWQLNAAKGDVLEIACLGYLTQTVVVGDRDFIGTKLDEDVTLLDETVVVGYATMKKRDLVGAVDQVDSKVLGTPSGLAGYQFNPGYQVQGMVKDDYVFVYIPKVTLAAGGTITLESSLGINGSGAVQTGKGWSDIKFIDISFN